jgi:hypothetical protein
MKSKRYLFTLPAGICLMWLVACATVSETETAQESTRTISADRIEFDYADGTSLLAVSPGQEQIMTLKDFRVGTGQNRILVVGVHAEENGKKNVGDMKISSVTYGDRELTLMSGSEIQVSSMWRGAEYFLKVALYYLINPPSGTRDITVTFAGPVTSGNVGAISLYNVRQAAPVTLVTNKKTNSSKKSEIITKITTENDGAWIVDIVGCGKKSRLDTKTKDHVRRFNPLEKSGTRSSLAGGTLPVLTAGEVTLHWVQLRLTLNRLAHVAVEIAPYN